jgi:N-acetylglutamate synthase-like GNAT family acetyltransferase
MHGMRIRTATGDDAVSIHAFLGENGWGHRLAGIDNFVLLLERSQRTAVALDGGRVVGFARGITDGLSNGYLSMVAVSDTHRRRGIGTRLVEHVIGTDTGITWVLRSGRDGSEAFFAALGFEPSAIAMERRRRTAQPPGAGQ